MGWFDGVEHQRWLSLRLQELLEYGEKTRVETGFACLDSKGQIDYSQPIQLYITARMTHVFSMGVLMGIPGCRNLADHGIYCINEYFRDRVHGGWYDAIEHKIDTQGNAVPYPGRDDKRAYSHAFVLLGAASATACGRMGAVELLHEAIDDNNRHWWDLEYQMIRESYNRDYTVCEPYRGIDSNMHTVEAYLVVADVKHDDVWLERALAILRRVSNNARANNWRLPEHYTQDWQPDLEYHADDRLNTHRAYGFEVGHVFELCRLMLQARAMLQQAKKPVPDWLLESATEMFDRARKDSWRRDGRPGFVFTVDVDGQPIISDRLAWVAFEALGATVALYRTTCNDQGSPADMERYEHCYRSWLDYIHEFFLARGGRIINRLDANNQPVDLDNHTLRDCYYHSVQAMLLPRLPLTPSIAVALSAGLLDQPNWRRGLTKTRRWW